MLLELILSVMNVIPRNTQGTMNWEINILISIIHLTFIYGEPFGITLSHIKITWWKQWNLKYLKCSIVTKTTNTFVRRNASNVINKLRVMFQLWAVTWKVEYKLKKGLQLWVFLHLLMAQQIHYSLSKMNHCQQSFLSAVLSFEFFSILQWKLPLRGNISKITCLKI